MLSRAVQRRRVDTHQTRGAGYAAKDPLLVAADESAHCEASQLHGVCCVNFKLKVGRIVVIVGPVIREGRFEEPSRGEVLL